MKSGEGRAGREKRRKDVKEGVQEGRGGKGEKEGGEAWREGGSHSLLVESLIRATSVRANLSRSELI